MVTCLLRALADGIKGSAMGEGGTPEAVPEDTPSWKRQLGNVLAYARLFQCERAMPRCPCRSDRHRLVPAIGAPLVGLFAIAGPLIIANVVIITLELLFGGG